MRSPGNFDWDPARLAAMASTLDERLAGLYQPDPKGTASTDCEASAQRWRYILRSGSGDFLAKRLHWDGYTSVEVPGILGPVVATQETPLPRWMLRLEDAKVRLPLIRHAFAHSPGDPLFRCISGQEPVPFEELLMPLVLSFADSLHKRAAKYAEGAALVSEKAWAMLERVLLQRLAAMANAVLMAEWQNDVDGVQGNMCPTVNAEDPRYRSFVDLMLAGELFKVWMKFPVMARILASITENHVEACDEVIRRLFTDRNVLTAAYNGGHNLGSVESIQTGFSDYHNGGRSVAKLRFESGIELIYKPRNLGLEQGFQTLLEWINRRVPEWPAFRTLTVVDCGTHGWMEYANVAPCTTPTETNRYYGCLGRLLCLFYGLAGTDLHSENIIPAGEHPVIVDLETLFHPDGPDAVGQVTLQRTDFLPRRLTGPAGNDCIVSGLGRWSGQAGTVLTPSHVECMVDGFETMYRFLLTARQELLAKNGPLVVFRACKGRFLFRATHIYMHLLAQSLKPELLRDGAAWSIEFECILRKALIRFDDAPAWWGLLKSEIEALRCLDVPYFATRVGSDAIHAGSGLMLDGYFARSGFGLAISTLSELNENDLAHQRQILRSSILATL